MSKSYSDKLHRLTIYLGYGDKGKSVAAEIRAAASSLNLSVSKFIVDKLNISDTKTEHPQNP